MVQQNYQESIFFFVQKSSLETVIVNPWIQMGIQKVPKEILDSGPEYAIAVGLALREV